MGVALYFSDAANKQAINQTNHVNITIIEIKIRSYFAKGYKYAI